MSQALYKDFFTIDEKYKPVMTREEFAKEPKMWLGFYPHQSFIDFLRSVLEQMERCQKSVWLTGAYGTGKTYAALVLQKLFNDSDDNIKEWFLKRKQQFPADTIFKSLQKQRKSRVLAVFETGSDATGAKEQFLVRIEQAIVRVLQDRQMVIPPKGDLDKIIERIREEGNNFFITRDSIQHRLAHLNASYKKFADLEKGLNNEDLRDGLLCDSMAVLRERSIYLELSSSSLLTWVNEVLLRNKLSKLVFIWDEFSAYIDKNRSELKTLEELAEASQQGKFFFIPVTHMKIDAYLAAGADSAKKANDRFEFKALDMPNDTAFRLVADAFQVHPDKEKDWEVERVHLWHNVKDVVDIHFREENDIQAESFNCILPIHPVAAYVLKHLATFVGSNQRSLFDYLKNDAKGSEFKQFIESGGPEVDGKQFLTVDHLWKYFVERDDLGQDQKLLEIKSEYLRQAANFQQLEEHRVFKTILLLSLLGRLQKGAHRLLQPTVENVVQSFKGDGAIIGVDMLIKQLEGKGCFHVVNGRCEMFRSNINEVELEKKKNELRSKFNTLVLSVKTKEAIEKKIKDLNIGDRFEVRVTSIDTISTNILNRSRFAPATEKDSGNQILVQFVFAKDEEEKLKIPEKLQSLAKHYHDHRMLFFTMPITFCENNSQHWEEYITYWAQRELALDTTEQQRYKEVTDKWDEEWKRMLVDTSQRIVGYKPGKDAVPENLQWETIKQYLLNFVQLTLPDCVDKYSNFGMNVFMADALKMWAESGITFQPKQATGQAISAFKCHSITGDKDWFENNPQHPLRKMRDLCLDKLKNTVGKNTTCSIRKIYIELQRAPYGLRYNRYSAFVLGFVLKEFLEQKQPLQWTNGQITKPLDQATLAEIIESVVKDDGNNDIREEKLICRLSKEEKAFIERSPTMFGISTNTDDTVEAVVLACQKRIETISNRVPLWCLSGYIEMYDPQSELCRNIIDNFCTASSISSKSKTEDRSNYIQQIGQCLLQTDGLAEAFSKYITPDKFAEAFHLYVDTKEPNLKKAAADVGDHTQRYCDVIKLKLSETASWLWKEADYSSVIACVLREYQVIKLLQSLWGNNGFVTYDTAVSQLRNAVFQKNKIPVALITEAYPALLELVDALDKPKELDISESLLDILNRDTDAIKRVFYNPINEVQNTLLAEKLGDVPSETLKEVYDMLPNDGANSDETSFIQSVRSFVQRYLEDSLAAQVKNLWQEKSCSQSPKDWAEKNNASFGLLFENEDMPRDLQTAIDTPKTFTSEKLKSLLESLQNWTLPKISEKQKIIESGKRKIEKLSDKDAKNLLKSLLEKLPEMVLALLK